MKQSLYSIYDRKTEVHMPPMAYFNDGHCKRSLMSELQNQLHSQLRQFPNDFEIVQVGEWDDSLGVVAPISPTRTVCRIAVLFPKDGEKQVESEGAD